MRTSSSHAAYLVGTWNPQMEDVAGLRAFSTTCGGPGSRTWAGGHVEGRSAIEDAGATVVPPPLPGRGAHLEGEEDSAEAHCTGVHEARAGEEGRREHVESVAEEEEDGGHRGEDDAAEGVLELHALPEEAGHVVVQVPLVCMDERGLQEARPVAREHGSRVEAGDGDVADGRKEDQRLEPDQADCHRRLDGQSVDLGGELHQHHEREPVRAAALAATPHFGGESPKSAAAWFRRTLRAPAHGPRVASARRCVGGRGEEACALMLTRWERRKPRRAQSKG